MQGRWGRCDGIDGEAGEGDVYYGYDSGAMNLVFLTKGIIEGLEAERV